MSRAAKTEWQRRRRAEAAIAAGRAPGRTGRPATGRRAPKCHGDRVAQRRRARIRLLQSRGDNGWVETRHPIMDEAITVARRHTKPDQGLYIFDPLHEEAICTAALAILERQDPDAAVAEFVRGERAWAFQTAPLFQGGDAFEGA